MEAKKSVFISYRHTNVYVARAVHRNLSERGFDVFIDYESIHAGEFETIIMDQIAARTHFLPILTPSALERCTSPEDWVRREIEQAIMLKRNIIPLMFEGFSWEDVGEFLVGDALKKLPSFQGVSIPSQYFEAAMDTLAQRFLGDATENIVLKERSATAMAYEERNDQIAEEAAPVDDALRRAEVFYEQGLSYHHNGQRAQAIQAYTQAIYINPDLVDAYYRRGLAYNGSWQQDKAIADWETIVENWPDWSKILLVKSRIAEAKEDFDAAIQFAEAATQERAHDYASFVWLGACYRRRYRKFGDRSDLEKAIPNYDEAIRLNPGRPNLYNSRGLAYKEMGNLQRAFADYTKTLELNPEQSYSHTNRAVLYFQIGEYENALRDYNETLRIVPGYLRALAGKAITLHALGDEAMAARLWGLVLDFDPKFCDAEVAGNAFNWHRYHIQEARELVAKLPRLLDAIPCSG